MPSCGVTQFATNRRMATMTIAATNMHISAIKTERPPRDMKLSNAYLKEAFTPTPFLPVAPLLRPKRDGRMEIQFGENVNRAHPAGGRPPRRRARLPPCRR